MTGVEKSFLLAKPQVPINFSLVACFEGEMEEARLRRALDVLHGAYPIAASRVLLAERGQAFLTSEGVPEFPLRVVEPAREGDWRAVVTRELGENYDVDRGPLLRVVLLKRGASAGSPAGGELVLIFHHGIGDGISGVYFLRDLLRLLDDPAAAVQEIPEVPATTDLVPNTSIQSAGIKKQIQNMKNGLWLAEHVRLLSAVLPHADRLVEGRLPWQHFTLASRILSQEQTRRLSERCRAEGVTVHAAIGSAWLSARLADGPGKRGWERTISTPVNLRGQLNLPEMFGNCMSTAITTVSCRPERGFWEVARDLREAFQKEISSGRVYEWAAGLGGLINSASETAVRLAIPLSIPQPLNYDFSISNLGRLPILTRAGALDLTCVYGPLVDTSEQELTVGVSTVCDRMTMTLVCRDYVVSAAAAERMADSAMATLEKAVGA